MQCIIDMLQLLIWNILSFFFNYNVWKLILFEGKYFCTGCHENQMAIIPARVVQVGFIFALKSSDFIKTDMNDI